MTLNLMMPKAKLGGYGNTPYYVVDDSDPRRHDPTWYLLDPGTMEGDVFVTRHNRYKVYPDMTAKALNKEGQVIERIGDCHICGNGAAYNTPCVDPSIGLQESPIWCDRCASKSDKFLVGIEQWVTNGLRSYNKQYGVVRKRGIVAHLDNPWEEGGTIAVAWFDGGSTAIPGARVKSREYGSNEKSGVEEFLDAMADIREAGDYFCTKCGDRIHESEVAGRPLFAGIACDPCMVKHKEHLANQRKAGQVCRLCGSPYSACCC